MAKLIDTTGKALSGEWGTDDESGSGIPVLRTTNFTNEGVVNYNNVVTRTISKKNIDEKYLCPGDIIIEKSGGSDKQPVGRVIYYDGPEKTYLFNNFTGLLRVKNKSRWHPRYVFYSLYSNYRKGGTREYENKTTGLHNLKTDAYVSRYEVADASFFHQKQICEHLDIIAGIIRLRQQELQKLDDLIKARFVEMFGDLHYNPKGWDIKSFDELTILITDGEHATPRRVEQGIYLLSARNVHNHSLQLADVDYIDEEEYERIAKRIIPQEGDVLISCSGTVGRCCSVPAGIKFQMVRSAALLRFKDSINPVFAEYMITSDYIQEQINSSKTASSQANLFQGKIAKLKGFVPPIELQNEFLNFVAQVDKSKSHKKTNYKTNNKLAS
jgi:type I restriction enzyme S subunit